MLSYLAVNTSEAGGEFAFVQTSLLSSCKCQLVSIRTSDLHIKSGKVRIKARSSPALLTFKGQVTEQTTVKWFIRLRNQVFYDQLQPRAQGLSYFHPRCAADEKHVTVHAYPSSTFHVSPMMDQLPIMKCYLYWLLLCVKSKHFVICNGKICTPCKECVRLSWRAFIRDAETTVTWSICVCIIWYK